MMMTTSNKLALGLSAAAALGLGSWLYWSNTGTQKHKTDEDPPMVKEVKDSGLESDGDDKVSAVRTVPSSSSTSFAIICA